MNLFFFAALLFPINLTLGSFHHGRFDFPIIHFIIRRGYTELSTPITNRKKYTFEVEYQYQIPQPREQLKVSSTSEIQRSQN
ncbi:hypothetical protein AFLA_009015 [Aspergillus flavus NRRL3357]|nr:hypothetical protein AFLA_009015 [Aspergillus flavus NRRL3357]